MQILRKDYVARLAEKNRKIDRKRVWHLWFAWWPVRVGRHTIAWLETVWRKGDYTWPSSRTGSFTYTYREYIKGFPPVEDFKDTDPDSPVHDLDAVFIDKTYVDNVKFPRMSEAAFHKMNHFQRQNWFLEEQQKIKNKLVVNLYAEIDAKKKKMKRNSTY
jgi:hypothetical protein